MLKNIPATNATEICEEYPQYITYLALIFYIVFIISSLLLNLLLIIIIHYKQTKKNTNIKSFFTSQSVASGLLNISMCIEVRDTLDSNFSPSVVLCKINAYIVEAVLLLITLHMLAITVDRYIKLKYLEFQRKTIQRPILISAIIWVLAITIPIMIIPAGTSVLSECQVMTCRNTGMGEQYRHITYLIIGILQFVIPFTLMIILYSILIYEIYKSVKRNKILDSQTGALEARGASTATFSQSKSVVVQQFSAQGISSDKDVDVFHHTDAKLYYKPYNSALCISNTTNKPFKSTVSSHPQINIMQRKKGKVRERQKVATTIILQLTAFFLTWTPCVVCRCMIVLGYPVISIGFRIAEIILLTYPIFNPIILLSQPSMWNRAKFIFTDLFKT